MKKIITLLIIVLSNTICFAEWEATGPNYATLSKICFEGNNLYAHDSKKVYLSTDKGDSWIPFGNNPYQNHSISTFLTNKDKVYVGLFEGLTSTTDRGQHWILDSNIWGYTYIKDIKKNGNDIFVLCGDSLLLSTDDGQSWKRISPDNWKDKLVIEVSGNNIYAGGLGMINNPNFIISNDYGKNWKIINDTLTGLKSERIISLASNGNYIYVGTQDYGLYISSNGGATWERAKSIYVNWSSIYSLFCKGDTVYAGNYYGLYFSTDKGENWFSTNFNKKVDDIRINSEDIYLASEGLAVSTDNGESWTLKQKGLNGIVINDIVEYNNDIYIGSNQGVLITNNKCKSWEQFNAISMGSSISCVAFLDSNIFNSLSNSNLEYSNDFGKKWKTAIDSNLEVITKIKCFAVDNVKKNVFAGNYISTNFGKNWRSIIPSSQINSALIKGEEIYAAAGVLGIYISKDYGVNWKNYNTQNGLPCNVNVGVTSLALCQNNIIAGTYSTSNDLYGICDKKYGLYISKDGGENFVQISDSSTLLNIYDLKTIKNYIFAATDCGILFSSDCGENWNKPDDIISALQINKLLIFGNYIYAGTTSGVYKAPLSDFGVTDVEEESISDKGNNLHAFPPYPLPANDEVRSFINWDASIDIDKADIGIYNTYGLKVSDGENITIDKESAFSGLLTWNCSNVPSGIYLIRIQLGLKTLTLKTIVNR